MISSTASKYSIPQTKSKPVSAGYVRSEVRKTVETIKGGDPDGESHIPGIDFSSGDLLIFRDFDFGTFKDIRGGNIVTGSKTGDLVFVNSVADLRELVTASSGIQAKAGDCPDSLLLEIDQENGAQTVIVDGVGTDFFAGQDLF